MLSNAFSSLFCSHLRLINSIMLNNIQRQTKSQQDYHQVKINNKNGVHPNALVEAQYTYEDHLRQVFTIEANRQVESKLKVVREVHAFVRAQQQFQQSKFYDRKCVYLVSSQWMKRWKKYTKFDNISKGLSLEWEWSLSPEALGCINDDIVDKQQVSTLNINNFQHLSVFLKDSVVEERDFQYFSEGMWQVINHYRNIEVKREIKVDHGQKIVQIFPLKIELVMVSNRILNSFKNQTCTTIPKETIQFTRFSTMAYFQLTTSEAITQCLSQIRESNLQQIDYENIRKRFLLLDPTFSFQKMKTRVKRSLQAQEGMKEFTVCLPVQELQYEMTFNDEVGSTNPILICEIIEKNESKETQIFYEAKKDVHSRCPKCKNYQKLQFRCRCQHIAYCSDSCKNQDVLHVRKCAAKKQVKNGDGIVRKRNGAVGLSNLGNTCFMNSGIQCISHIEALTEYFISNKYVHDINKNNPLGTKGNLSNSYGNLVRHLWCEHERVFSPHEFKKQVSSFQRMFSGYNQHDAGQFVTYLLEGLHEDLNKVKDKPYVESKQMDERQEWVIADEQWSNFLRRNNSKIVELMYGQYRSQVDCPKCKYKSCQFDPFMMCSLPIMDLSQRVSIAFQNDLQIHEQVVQVHFKKRDALAVAAQQIRIRKSLPQTTKIILYSSKTLLRQQDEIAEALARYKTGICARALSIHEDYANGFKFIVSFKCQNKTSMGQIHEQTYSIKMFKFKPSFTCMDVHQYLYSLNQKALRVESYEETVKKEPQSRDIAIMIDSTELSGLCWYCNLKCKGCYFPYTAQTIQQFCFKRSTLIQLKYIIRKIPQIALSRPLVSHQWTSAASVSLTDCFLAFQEPQILTIDNAWYCPKCKQHVVAQKQMMIYKAPKILILCLKRFKKKGQYTEKNECFINFPVRDLDLSKVVINGELPRNPNQTSTDDNIMKSERILYDLFAVSNHIGSSGTGHYTATCKNPGSNSWFIFDDSSVHEISPQSVVGKNAYLLFYVRK